MQGVTPLTGYQGPAASPYLIPTAGTAVEIDSVDLMRIDNVHIADGGIGPGNSAFQCGLDESDPTGAISGAVASVTFTNSRLDSNPALAGPGNPDFALRIDNSCRGSVYRNLTAYDGGKADVLQYNANVLTQIHVDSDAINTTGGASPVINWASTSIANFGFAGVADYGVYVIGATALSQTVCGIANTACVLTIPNVAAGSLNAGQITDTQMRCGAFTNVPTGYLGVELGAGAINTTVSGTASAGKCGIPPLQLIRMDAPADLAAATISLCNNSNAPVSGCTGYQGPFATGQFYTQPVVSFSTVVVTANTLYAVPFFSPASGGPITKLGLDVRSGGSGHCEVGVYNAFGGLPSTLIADGGALTFSVAGTIVTTGTFSAPVQLAPRTLYFLAVGCDSAPTLEAANAGSLSTTLLGAPSTTTTVTQISTLWTFSSGGLPTLFDTGTITSTPGGIPNVYAGP